MVALTAIEELIRKRGKEKKKRTENSEAAATNVSVNPSKKLSLMEAILKCLGRGTEYSLSSSSSSSSFASSSSSSSSSRTDFQNKIPVDNPPAVEKHAADAFSMTELDPPAARPETALGEAQEGVRLPDVPAPGESRGCGGRHN